MFLINSSGYSAVKKRLWAKKATHNHQQDMRIVVKKQVRNNKKSHVLREDGQKRPLKKAKALFLNSPEPLITSFLIYGSELAR